MISMKIYWLGMKVAVSFFLFNGEGGYYEN